MPDRREKNLRHLATIISVVLGLGLVWLLATLRLVKPWTINPSLVLFAVVLGVRTILVELGIRRRGA